MWGSRESEQFAAWRAASGAPASVSTGPEAGRFGDDLGDASAVSIRAAVATPPASRAARRLTPATLTALFLLLPSAACARPPAASPSAQDPSAHEPVVGGPCEGCELVFEGMPASPPATARIAPEDEPGEPMTLEGVVRDARGNPVAGVTVYAYQTDAGGIYPRGSTAHGRLRGWARTGADGRYRFDTIRPGSYPSRNAPAHVHMHVVEPGCCTYYIDDVEFRDDPLLRRTEGRGRGGQGIVTPSRGTDGRWRAVRDIALGEKVPGHPGREGG